MEGSLTFGHHFFQGGWIDPMPCGHVTIGDYVVLGHGSRIIRHGPIRPFEHDSIRIGDFCYIGDGARILLGADIGKGCVVGTMAVISGVVPAYSIVAGNPARVVRKRDAYEMLRTFVLKYRDPDPQGLGAKDPDWSLLLWEDIETLLLEPRYDDFDFDAARGDVMAVVSHYRMEWENRLAQARARRA